MAYPIHLTGLTTREAITDTLYRGVLGFDKNSSELLNSACVSSDKDTLFEVYEGGKLIQSVPNAFSIARETILGQVGPMDTTHMISNVRIDVKEGEEMASVMAYALAQHCKEGTGREVDGSKFLVGGEYRIEMVKEDGEWRIRKWVLDVIWRQGDASVMPNRE
jgi:hypothetical protein